MTQTEIISQLNRYFTSTEEIHTVILYGSAVTDNYTLNSDVDVAVAADHLLSPEERVDIHQDLEKLLLCKVDLRDLSNLHGTILYEVLFKGKVIKKENVRYFEKKCIEMVVYRQDIYPILKTGMKRRLREFAGG